MDFFQSQESLTEIQWILRAIVSFFFLLLVAKLMGQRSLSQLRLLDFVMALIIGNIIAHPLSDPELDLKGSLTTITVLVFLYLIGVFASLKWSMFRKFVESSPIPLIKDGQIMYKGLSKARISLDVLLSELRKEKIEAPEKISLALWEPDGTISFFINPQHQAVTPSDLQLVTKAFHYPSTIIKEGKMDLNELKRTGKDELWLTNEIKNTYNLGVKEILLATMDHNDHIKIFLYVK